MTNQRKPRILVLEASTASTVCVRRAGGEPITVPPVDYVDAIDVLDYGVEGVLLTGGGDVDPRLYDQKPNKHVYGVSETRDATELMVLDWARTAGVPVMGICRGSQIMNVEAGGTLRQHLGGHYGWHPVTTSGLLKEIAGTRIHSVRSLHHQVVRKVAPSFEVVARSECGDIEAIASRDGRCLGVQFHPEMMAATAHSRALFGWLVSASARAAGMPLPAGPSGARKRAARKAREVIDYRLSWFCPHCGIRFDEQDDHLDHMDVFHADDEVSAR